MEGIWEANQAEFGKMYNGVIIIIIIIILMQDMV